MPSLKLKVEVKTSLSIENCFNEAVQLADKLGLIVEFVHYGVVCQAYPNTNYNIGVEQYLSIRNDPGPDKIAFTKI